MWTISELKNRAKVVFRANYWHCVVVALILSLVISGGSSSGGRNNQINMNQNSHTSTVFESEDYIFSVDANRPIIAAGINGLINGVLPSFFSGITAVAVAGAALFVLAFGLALSVLVLNVLEVGCRKFFIANHYDPTAQIGIIGSVFTSGNYANLVVAQLIKKIQISLWTLLLIVPGIIKSYELRMVPYLLAEFPDADRKAIFERSKYMMNGEKLNAFILDLSFIGWSFLSAITLGLVGLFYAKPYIYATDAELYEVLKQK